MEQRAAAATLVRGDLFDYRRLREQHPALPERNDAVWAGSADRSILTGLLHQMQGVDGC